MNLANFVIRDDRIRARIADAARTMPEGTEVVFREPTRNADQNAKLHTLLSEIAKGKQWVGQWLSIEDWKRLMTAAWLLARGDHIRILPAVDGHGFVPIYQRTSTLSRSECGELIDYVEAWWSDQPERPPLTQEGYADARADRVIDAEICGLTPKQVAA